MPRLNWKEWVFTDGNFITNKENGSMLQFAVGFVITPSCRGGRSKPKMGCRPSQKQNNAKKQVPSL
jgi:hypothetical protein